MLAMTFLMDLCSNAPVLLKEVNLIASAGLAKECGLKMFSRGVEPNEKSGRNISLGGRGSLKVFPNFIFQIAFFLTNQS